MSRPVELPDLAAAVATAGPNAFLCTVGGDGHPKVVHVPVRPDGTALLAPVGPGTVRNVAAQPQVTLLWPATADQSMSLLVDATATATNAEGVIRLEPGSAVWHRPAPEFPET